MGHPCGKAEQGRAQGTVRFEQIRLIYSPASCWVFSFAKKGGLRRVNQRFSGCFWVFILPMVAVCSRKKRRVFCKFLLRQHSHHRSKHWTKLQCHQAHTYKGQRAPTHHSEQGFMVCNELRHRRRVGLIKANKTFAGSVAH
jgi:hypothetical protein